MNRAVTAGKVRENLERVSLLDGGAISPATLRSAERAGLLLSAVLPVGVVACNIGGNGLAQRVGCQNEFGGVEEMRKEEAE